ncbi:MAG: hypothetical protein H7X95_01480 [Deltaproteobacteria bacterium]|nr:hypothetical protein [Deltaproteobacteria bacterium]
MGDAWLAAVLGATIVVRSGFDDDSMLRAAVRLALPVVVMRGREDRIDVVSFRRHGPCAHAPLDVPEKAGAAPEDGAGTVVAAHIAAAEALALVAGAITGEGRARHVSIPIPGAAVWPERSTDIPWSPECFACGGAGAEMSFS